MNENRLQPLKQRLGGGFFEAMRAVFYKSPRAPTVAFI
jgi:hypothetical protein